jgi:hypothetical protein
VGAPVDAVVDADAVADADDPDGATVGCWAEDEDGSAITSAARHSIQRGP